MTFADLVSELKRMDNSQRLSLIEAASRMVRDELPASHHTSSDAQIRDAANRLRDLYEPGGELTEWTALDGEEVLDDSDRHAG